MEPMRIHIYIYRVVVVAVGFFPLAGDCRHGCSVH